MEISYYVRKYRILLPVLKIMSQLLSYKRSNWIAARFVKYLNPRLEEKEIVCERMKLYLQLQNKNQINKAWNSYTNHIGVYDNQIYHYAKLNKKWLAKCVEVKGGEYIQSPINSNSSVLVMTYHHHYNLLLCALFGLMGYPTSPIAMDPKETPLYKFFSKLGDRMYRNAEQHFSGGNFIYVKPRASYIRSIVRTISKNHVIITANDFPDPFSAKRRKVFPFLGTTLACPTGSVEISLKKKIPIVTAFLKWIGNDQFQLIIQPIDATTIEDVMTQYLAHLELMIKSDPGLWEGWKWLNP